MHMIAQVTEHTFEYDKQHKVLKIVADLLEVGAPPPSPGEQQQQRLMHLRVVQQQQEHLLHHVLLHVHPRCRSSPSPIRKMFSAIFGMCRDIQTRQRRERGARRKDTRTLKLITQNLELNPPRSPLLDEDLSDPETKEQRQVRYDREFAEFLQRQEQQQQQAPEHPDTLPLQARVPTHS